MKQIRISWKGMPSSHKYRNDDKLSQDSYVIFKQPTLPIMLEIQLMFIKNEIKKTKYMEIAKKNKEFLGKININHFIPSFGAFILFCKESDIEDDLFKEILKEFLDNPKKYNSLAMIKNYLSEKLPINSYIQLISRMN